MIVVETTALQAQKTYYLLRSLVTTHRGSQGQIPVSGEGAGGHIQTPGVQKLIQIRVSRIFKSISRK